MDLSSKKILVVGAGLAGLSAAISLAKRGARVSVIDRHDHAEGASIGIANRAVNALEELGVLETAVASGFAPHGAEPIFARMMDSAGNKLPAGPTPPGPHGPLPGVVLIYRPVLTRILTDAAVEAGASVRTGLGLQSVCEVGDQVQATFDDGTAAGYDLVVAADGTRSTVRTQVFPDIHPQYTGWMSFRIVLENGPKGEAGFFVQPDGNMVAVSLLRGDLTYLATGRAMEKRLLDNSEALLLLDGLLAPFTAPLVTAIRNRLGEKPHVITRPFEWLLLPRPWHRGRIVFIGDSVHTTTANLSSGGGMAIEDGVVLAQELEHGDELDAALNSFAARREPRVRLVVEGSLELLRLQGERSAPALGAAIRARAVAALMQPY